MGETWSDVYGSTIHIEWTGVYSVEEKDITFVTKKVLVTFSHPICLMVDGNAINCGAAICEYQESDQANSRLSIPQEFLVVALPNGQKMTKSIRVRVQGFGTVMAIADLEGPANAPAAESEISAAA